jgi:hypothetical protein
MAHHVRRVGGYTCDLHLNAAEIGIREPLGRVIRQQVLRSEFITDFFQKAFFARCSCRMFGDGAAVSLSPEPVQSRINGEQEQRHFESISFMIASRMAGKSEMFSAGRLPKSAASSRNNLSYGL